MRLSKVAAIPVLACALIGCVAPAPDDTLVGDYLTGHFAARLNDVDAAARYFARAHSEAPQSDEILREAFFFHLAAGEPEAAVVFADKLKAREINGSAGDGMSRVALASHAIKTGNYASARAFLTDEIDASYFLPVRSILYAWALAGAEGADAALLHMSQTPSGGFRGFNPLHQALLAEKAGRTDETLAAHQLSIMTFGGPVGREAYGAYLERVGDMDTAREYYELLLQDEGAERAIAKAGLARIARGEATTKYAATTPSQGAAIALYSFGAAFLEQALQQKTAAEKAGMRIRQENYNLPLIFSQLALYLDPELDVARRFAGSIMKVYGDHEKAIATLATIGPASPYYESAQIEIAGSYVLMERENEALGHLRRVVAENPDALRARMSLAGLYSTLERHDDALRVLDALIDKLPAEPSVDAWRYFVSRGAAHLALDQWPQAEADLERAVEIAPEEPTALNYLGYSWAERGENLEKAFELIEKAVALQPDSGAIIDSLGWAHYQLGNYDDAVGYLEQAATLVPDDPVITDHLGDVYWRLDRKIEARFQWRHALELEPDEKLEASLNQKLEHGLSDKSP